MSERANQIVTRLIADGYEAGFLHRGKAMVIIEVAIAQREAQVRAELTDDVVTRTAYHKGFAAGQAEEREKVAGLVEALVDKYIANRGTDNEFVRCFTELKLTDEPWKSALQYLATYNDNRKG